MANEDVLTMTVQEFLERSVKLIVRDSTVGPNFNKRVDLYYDLELTDGRLGRKHRIRARIKVTAVSLIFDQK